MNTIPGNLKKLAVVSAIALALTACASAPREPQGTAAVRSKLTQLQGDSELATLAPLEIRDAEAALRLAESPERDVALGAHRVLLADRKVEIARAWAQTRQYEAQREALNNESEQARLDDRTREADLARGETARARNATEVARDQAARARGETDIARDQAASARSDASIAQGAAVRARNDASAARGATERAEDSAANARAQTGIAQADAASARRANAATQQVNAELEREIAELNGRDTDRGLVITLGDVLFETGAATLQGGNTSNLDQLAAFLNRYTDRGVTIEGHTDDVGDSGANITLSQNRANAVRSYLVTQGVASNRFVASGMGEGTPVASNDSSAGRQQNRRVEVIIAEAR